VGDHKGYLTVGFYDDERPGEIFVTMAKEGSTVRGLMDTVATLVSICLQYGVPLEDLVHKFEYVKFEPQGVTDTQGIRFAHSIVDYIFRWLGRKYLAPAEPPETVEGEEEPAKGNGGNGNKGGNGGTKPQATNLPQRLGLAVRLQSDAPACSECGSIMVRNGSCYKCLNCGTTSGCS
jgi:ribonucleoside-diphosphate reductase alpha chain